MKKFATIWRVRLARARKRDRSIVWLTLAGVAVAALFFRLCLFLSQNPQWIPFACYPTSRGFCG